MSHLRFIPIVVGALALASTGLGAQQPPIPKEIATFKCMFNWCAETPRTSPSGKFVAQGGPTSLRMFDLASKRSWVLSEGEAEDVTWSPRGDMVAFGRDNPNGETYVWSMSVDPSTGKARGPAQRVSVGPGAGAKISPDSRWIMYEASDSTTVNTVMVPAAGGPVRVIAPGVSAIGFWSADAKTIYAVEWHDGTKGDVVKYRIDGGPHQTIYKGGGTIVGMTADHQYIIMVPVIYSKEKAAPSEQGTVIDTTGRVVGHFPLPTGEKQFDRVLGDTAIVWLTSTDRRFIDIKPIGGGSAKRWPLIGTSDESPIWSPDGKRIAFQVNDSSRRTVLAVSNVDGSNPRLFRDIVSVSEVHWSPDSRSLALLGTDRHRLSVLDLTTGAQRTVVNDTANTFGAFLRWRPDGRSLVGTIVGGGKKPSGDWGRAGFFEVSLSGQVVRISDIWGTLAPTSVRSINTLVGVSDHFIRSDTVAFMQPLAGGPIRWTVSVPAGTRTLGLVVSPDMQWIVGQYFVPKPTGNGQLELFSASNGARKVLDLPFETAGPLQFVPGDNSLLVIGGTGGGSPLDLSGSRADTTLKLFRVPLNGDTPRVFSELGMIQRWQGTLPSLSVSPDGKFVAYTVQPEVSTQSLGLISLRGAIPATTRRPRK